MNHPEWTKNNSLTSPRDKNLTETRQCTSGIPPLNNNELTNAMECLNVTTSGLDFMKIERRYADPPLSLQKIGLISFTPAKGATPDQDGFFGFAKLRGNFDTEEEANERAEFIIRNIDSYHKIYHAYVGRPFPITALSDFSKEIKDIDVHKKVADEISSDVKRKRMDEKREIEKIQTREKNLQNEVDKEFEDDGEVYTTLRTKKAQLIWTYLETLKKVEQMKESIIKTRKEIVEMDEQDPTLGETFYKKFMDARNSVGIKDDEQSLQNSFMKYLVEEADLGF